MTHMENQRRIDEWFAAEAHVSGKPLLIRGRKLSSGETPNTSFPFLVVLIHRYEVSDPTALPTNTQYDAISGFEKGTIDVLEREGLGMLTFVETYDGVVRYYCYARSVDAAADLVNERADERFYVEITSDEDAQWSEYRRLMGQVGK